MVCLLIINLECHSHPLPGLHLDMLSTSSACVWVWHSPKSTAAAHISKGVVYWHWGQLIRSAGEISSMGQPLSVCCSCVGADNTGRGLDLERGKERERLREREREGEMGRERGRERDGEGTERRTAGTDLLAQRDSSLDWSPCHCHACLISKHLHNRRRIPMAVREQNFSVFSTSVPGCVLVHLFPLFFSIFILHIVFSFSPFINSVNIVFSFVEITVSHFFKVETNECLIRHKDINKNVKILKMYTF